MDEKTTKFHDLWKIIMQDFLIVKSWEYCFSFLDVFFQS